MTRPFIIAAAAASLMAGTALAQTSTTTKPMTAPQATTLATGTQTTGAGAAATNTMGGIVMSTSASQPVKFATADTSDLMSSKLVGVNVYNKQNEKVGEISDLAIDNGKTIDGVVLSVGGFLGIGESYVLVEPSSLALNNDNGTWKAYIDTSKDALKNAPKFTYKAVDKKS
jgi:sporulation protein YlmC with PRC-barrel domain